MGRWGGCLRLDSVKEMKAKAAAATTSTATQYQSSGLLATCWFSRLLTGRSLWASATIGASRYSIQAGIVLRALMTLESWACAPGLTRR